MSALHRCFWVDDSTLYQHYHDEEWGRPVVDEQRLFEKLCLESFQSGLSWLTILRKREAFRAAFAGFDFHQMAQFDEADVNRLLADAGIVRHRGKIEAVLHNAKRACELQAEVGHLARFFWRYEVNTQARPVVVDAAYLRAQTTCPEAQALAKALKQRGWKFLGPTTVYAFMQAMGLVNDHEQACHCRDKVQAARAAMRLP